MTAWQHAGACVGVDPELFFPIGNTGPAVLQAAEAKEVCRRCPVVETCLRWALSTNQEAGVWGGLDEDERRSLKRRNARAARADRPLENELAPVDARVAATTARAAINEARDAGLTWTQVAAATGQHESLCRLVATGKQHTVMRSTEQEIVTGLIDLAVRA